MHHKFGIVDGKYLLNGSFNYTKQAKDKNFENLMILWNHPNVLEDYQDEFQNIWNMIEREDFQIEGPHRKRGKSCD